MQPLTSGNKHSVLGKAFGLGMGEQNGDEVAAEEEAFKDGHQDKQGCPPTPSDVMGGSGGGWEEEGRGRKRSGLQSRARARGHANACRWYAEDGGAQIASDCLGAQHRDNWVYYSLHK